MMQTAISKADFDAMMAEMALLKKRVQELESSTPEQATRTADFTAREGQTLILEPPSSGIKCSLVKATKFNRGSRITFVQRTSNPVVFRAIDGMVNGAPFVISNAVGAFDAVSDGQTGWHLDQSIGPTGVAGAPGTPAPVTPPALGFPADDDGPMFLFVPPTPPRLPRTYIVNGLSGTLTDLVLPGDMQPGDTLAIQLTGNVTLNSITPPPGATPAGSPVTGWWFYLCLNDITGAFKLTIPDGGTTTTGGAFRTPGQEFGGVGVSYVMGSEEELATVVFAGAWRILSSAAQRISGDIEVPAGNGGTRQASLSTGRVPMPPPIVDEDAPPFIIGPPGPTGPTGLAGSTGATGPTGPAGDLSTVDNASWAAQQDNYSRSPTAASTIRFTLTGDQTLTGVVPRASSPDGELLALTSADTGDTLTIAHDATSTAANRFFLPELVDMRLAPGAGALFRYDATSSRWKLLNTSERGRLLRVTTYITGTAATHTWLDAARFALIDMCGGGGGGGSAAASTASNIALGGGGASGVPARLLYAIAAASMTYTVGASVAGNTNGNLSSVSDGTSSVSCPGGGLGGALANGSTAALVLGGAPTGSPTVVGSSFTVINASGALTPKNCAGGTGIRFSGTLGMSGEGGMSPITGAQAQGNIAQGVGTLGPGPGAGGSGGLSSNAAGAAAGGGGAAGIIIIYEYT